MTFAAPDWGDRLLSLGLSGLAAVCVLTR